MHDHAKLCCDLERISLMRCFRLSTLVCAVNWKVITWFTSDSPIIVFYPFRVPTDPPMTENSMFDISAVRCWYVHLGSVPRANSARELGLVIMATSPDTVRTGRETFNV